MQIDQPGDELDGVGSRLTQVKAGIGIEKPLFLVALAIKPDLGGLVGLFGVPNPAQPVLRISAVRGLAKFVVRKFVAADGDDARPRPDRFVELIAKDDGAAADADDEHIQAKRDAGPKMNLKDRLAQPDTLGPP